MADITATSVTLSSLIILSCAIIKHQNYYQRQANNNMSRNYGGTHRMTSFTNGLEACMCHEDSFSGACPDARLAQHRHSLPPIVDTGHRDFYFSDYSNTKSRNYKRAHHNIVHSRYASSYSEPYSNSSSLSYSRAQPVISRYNQSSHSYYSSYSFSYGVARGGGGGGGGGGWGPVIGHLPSSTTQESHGARHRHDVENNYENILSERVSSLRIEDGYGGGGGGSFEDGIQATIDHSVSADQLNPQHPIADDADDSIFTSTDGHLHDSTSGSLSNGIDTTPTPTTAHKSEDGLPANLEVPYESGVLCSKSINLPLDIDSCPTPQVDIPINNGDTLVNNEPKRTLLERRKSLGEPEDTKQHKTRRLACPYAKHDPEIYGYRCRSGYHEIHRLKEHLYRVHLEQQPHCVRCGEIFSDESGVKAHLNRRPDEICDVVADVSVVGLSSYQMKQLRSKKRKPGVTTIGEKWRHIYGIIFPDVTDFPDPYLSHFDDRSNSPDLLPISQSNVESIRSSISPESEDRIFTDIEKTCGVSLKKSKRQKIRNTIRHVIVETVQKMIRSKTISRNERASVHLHVPSPAGVSFENTAPEPEEQFAEAQWSTTQKHANDPGQLALETPQMIGDQDHLESHFFNLSNEQMFSEMPSGNEETAGIGNETGANDFADVERPMTIASGSIVCETSVFETLVPFQDSVSFLQANEDFFDLDSILNDTKDDFASADWPTEHANLR